MPEQTPASMPGPHAPEPGNSVGLDAATALTRIADVLDDPAERDRIADLCSDKKAVVALIALMLRVGAFSV